MSGKNSFLLLLILVAMGAGIATWLSRDRDTVLIDAKRAMLLGDDNSALRLAEEYLQDFPEQPEALMIAGRAAMNQKRTTEALTWLDRIPDDATHGLEARLLCGNALLFEEFRVSQAEDQFQRVLRLDPNHEEAHNKLAWLLGVSGRVSDSNRHILTMLQKGTFDFVHLAVLVLNHDRIRDQETVHAWHTSSPEDPHVVLAQAALAFTNQEYQRAQELAHTVQTQQPTWPDAAVLHGTALLSLGRTDELIKWESGLSQEILEHPQVLAVRGMLAASHGQPAEAARLLLQSLEHDPAQRRTNYELGRALQTLGRTSDAAQFLERAEQLEEYERTAKTAWNTNQTTEIEKCAQLADALQLPAETNAWSLVAARQGSTSDWVRQRISLSRADAVSKNDLRRGTLQVNISADLHAFLEKAGSSEKVVIQSAAAKNSGSLNSHAIAFEEDTLRAGLQFRYRNGGHPEEGTRRLLETLGGGVGVIDYDGDTWADLFLPQGGSFPPASDAPPDDSDQLFRNLGGRSFQSVTDVAGLRDAAFSSGVSVGDIDNDGFPDLLVGNIGHNQLYRNNGDGTYQLATSDIHGDAAAWTTSSVIVDLNDDTWPDLYTVNYLSGDVLTRICDSTDGVPMSCLPQLFPAAQDQLFLSDGAGGFKDATSEMNLVCEGGNGLAVIAADFDNCGRPGLFVANDVAPNFYFRQSADSQQIQFSESGMVHGLALNGMAQHEACMGVAAGDINGDQRLDIFVTNFQNETNTIYRQVDGGLFVDHTDLSGLTQASRASLGFGTAMLDADLDGDLDLVVANGHINNYRSPDRPYKMRPQFFENDGTGVFQECEPGEYFRIPHLGRGLAWLDWNNDGLADFVVSDLASGAHLLTNRSQTDHHWISLKLIDAEGCRDAVTASVLVTLPGQLISRQLTAGSYLCSNDSQILIGVQDSSHVPAIDIQWADGTKQIIRNLEADRSYRVPKNRPAFAVPH